MAQTTRDRRKAAGLCVDCGMETPEAKRVRCAGCLAKDSQRACQKVAKETEEQRVVRLAKMVEQGHRRRKVRRAKRLCVQCGVSLAGEKPGPEGMAYQRCALCRGANRHSKCKQAWRERGFSEPLPQTSLVWSVGSAVPKLTGGHKFVVCLDGAAQEALRALMERYREGEAAKGNAVRTHALGATVRKAVGQWERFRVGPPPLGWSCSREVARLSLDARTMAIIAWQAEAQWFGGNRSAALRAMLWYSAFPKVIGKTGGRRAGGWS